MYDNIAYVYDVSYLFILILYMCVLHTYPRFKVWCCQQKTETKNANKSGSCLGDGIVFIAAWCLNSSVPLKQKA